ncbi:TetR/AcrR family transcriptional regulator [Nocardia sp. alder85J]|uniref:TetR/AcrR family transcriptional regulator n=1 Tax=Nocardia sp. alder85J TaxID=2862949 RepID=UPI001CD451B6|nr:TetR/AcrR family transcriptional regulator [Nocardia sp. alder85J]MCX4098186.1 TetR/AcrR family transcriptional regulator [Nocardia sp. alder85J]
MPPRSTAKGRTTRARILAGATRAVLETGAATTTLDDIRERSQVSKSQLFHYFPGGKDELLTEVAATEADRILTILRERVDPLVTWHAWDRWREQLLGEFDRTGADCPMQTLLHHLATATPGAAAVVRQLMLHWHTIIRTGITQMQATGDISATIDPDTAASAVLAAVHGGAILTTVTGSPDHLAAAFDSAVDRLRPKLLPNSAVRS